MPESLTRLSFLDGEGTEVELILSPENLSQMSELIDKRLIELAVLDESLGRLA